MTQTPLGWFGIFRLGLVQAALGAIVVLTTSTLNRVMVIELALPAILPGTLVALHYGVQVLRPGFGYGSDVDGRRTPWIIGGMAILGVGGIGAAAATGWMAASPAAGIALAVVSFILIGVGIGSAGTTLLALLAKRVAESRRAAAATIVWVMMIAGFILTTAVAGRFLDPFSPGRLLAVAAAVSAIAFLLVIAALWNIEGPAPAVIAEPAAKAPRGSFKQAIDQVWNEAESKRFAIFVFVSMLAYSAEELILEPFAGAVFGMSVGETTRLASVQNGGVLTGMILFAIIGTLFRGHPLGSLRNWTVGGCVASGGALAALAAAGYVGPSWPLRTSVFLLGLANGAFAVAAIGSMMALVGQGHRAREGTRMGLWGAAQAIAFGIGGLAGTSALDVARRVFDAGVSAYAVVIGGEAILFLIAAYLGSRIGRETVASGAAPLGMAGALRRG
jgi:BCD family chlorophyll transporter-like MFS transporter